MIKNIARERERGPRSSGIERAMPGYRNGNFSAGGLFLQKNIYI